MINEELDSRHGLPDHAWSSGIFQFYLHAAYKCNRDSAAAISSFPTAKYSNKSVTYAKNKR